MRRLLCCRAIIREHHRDGRQSFLGGGPAWFIGWTRERATRCTLNADVFNRTSHVYRCQKYLERRRDLSAVLYQGLVPAADQVLAAVGWTRRHAPIL